MATKKTQKWVNVDITASELEAQRWDREANNWKSLHDLSDKQIVRVIRTTMHDKYEASLRYAASCRRAS